MNQYITGISIILLLIIIIYSINKQFNKYIRKYREPFNVNQIQREINKVGKFGTDIGNLGRELGQQISKVGDLGNQISNLGPEIERIARYPVELGEELVNKVQDVASQAENFVNEEFDKIKDEVEGIANEVKNFAVDSINQIKGEIDRIGDVIESIPGIVTNLANEIFGEYIPKIFNEGWRYFKRYVIDPITDFFKQIGNVFENIGDVFKEIFRVLIRIPTCIPFYFYDASMKYAKKALDKILPEWLKNIINFVDNYITKPIIIPLLTFFKNILQTLLELVGFDFNLNALQEQRQKCYDFGPLTVVIRLFTELFKLIKRALEELFKLIPIDQIINEILKLFGLGGKKKKKNQSESLLSTASSLIQQGVDNTQQVINRFEQTSASAINSVTNTAQNIGNQARQALSDSGIEVPNVSLPNVSVPNVSVPNVPNFNFRLN